MIGVSACAICGAGLRDIDHRDRRAGGHLVADLDEYFAHGARRDCRHVHRRLVGLERDQGIVDGKLVAGADVHLDDRDVLEIAELGYHECLHAAGLARRFLRVGQHCRFAGRRGRDCRLGCVVRPGRQLILVRRRTIAGETQAADHVARRHPAADLDRDFLDDAVGRGRHVHRGLVGFERNEACFPGHAVAGRDQHFDDLDVRKIPEIGHDDFDGLGHARLPL